MHTVDAIRRGASRPVTSSVTPSPVSTACFIFYIYFVLDFFLRFSSRIPGYGKLKPTVLAFLIISGLLFLNREKLKGRFEDSVFQAFFVFLGYLVISLPIVEWPGSVIRDNLSDFVKAACFLFFTALIIDTDRRLKWFLVIFVGCQLFRVLEPLYLNITQDYWGSETHLGHGLFADRLSGAPADVVNPNGLGFVIATVVPFLHYLLFSRGWKCKLLYLALMPAILYALILTMSRGGLIGLAVVAFIVFKESRHKFFLILLGITVAIAGWSVMNPVQKDRYLSLIETDSEQGGGVEGRVGLTLAEFKLGFQRPIVGHGLGTTSEAKVHSWGTQQASHNMYGELMIEVGTTGFIIFMVFLWRVYKSLATNMETFKQIDARENPLYANLNRAMIAVFWMYAVYSLNYWGLSQYYWYLFAGLTIAFRRLMALELQRENQKTGSGDVSEGLNEKYPLARRRNYYHT